MKTFRSPKLVCPYCKKVNDRSTSTRNEDRRKPPGDGDISVCIGCRQFSVFSDGGKAVRPLTDEDWAMYEPELQAHIRLVAKTALVVGMMHEKPWVLQIGAEMARNGWKSIGLVMPSGRLEFVRPSDDGERLEPVPDAELNAELAEAEQIAVLRPL